MIKKVWNGENHVKTHILYYRTRLNWTHLQSEVEAQVANFYAITTPRCFHCVLALLFRPFHNVRHSHLRSIQYIASSSYSKELCTVRFLHWHFLGNTKNATPHVLLSKRQNTAVARCGLLGSIPWPAWMSCVRVILLKTTGFLLPPRVHLSSCSCSCFSMGCASWPSWVVVKPQQSYSRDMPGSSCRSLPTKITEIHLDLFLLAVQSGLMMSPHNSESSFARIIVIKYSSLVSQSTQIWDKYTRRVRAEFGN